MKPPRIPYLPADCQAPAELVATIRARRGGELLHLDRMLLHSPPFAAGWNALMGTVRTGLGVSARLREMAICAVAVLNGAPYEFHHHAPEFRRAGGSEEKLTALADPLAAATDPTRFDAVERDVLALTIQMTRDVEVADACFERVRAALGDAATVELVGTIASYNMVSRFLVALRIGPEQGSAAV